MLLLSSTAPAQMIRCLSLSFHFGWWLPYVGLMLMGTKIPADSIRGVCDIHVPHSAVYCSAIESPRSGRDSIGLEMGLEPMAEVMEVDEVEVWLAGVEQAVHLGADIGKQWEQLTAAHLSPDDLRFDGIPFPCIPSHLSPPPPPPHHHHHHSDTPQRIVSPGSSHHCNGRSHCSVFRVVVEPWTEKACVLECAREREFMWHRPSCRLNGLDR